MGSKKLLFVLALVAPFFSALADGAGSTVTQAYVHKNSCASSNPGEVLPYSNVVLPFRISCRATQGQIVQNFVSDLLSSHGEAYATADTTLDFSTVSGNPNFLIEVWGFAEPWDEGFDQLLKIGSTEPVCVSDAAPGFQSFGFKISDKSLGVDFNHQLQPPLNCPAPCAASISGTGTPANSDRAFADLKGSEHATGQFLGVSVDCTIEKLDL